MKNINDLISNNISNNNSKIKNSINKKRFNGLLISKLPFYVNSQTEEKMNLIIESIYVKIAKQCQLEQSLEAN